MNKKNERVPSMNFSVNIPHDLWAQLDKFSRETRIPKTDMVREGLRLWLEQNQKKTA